MIYCLLIVWALLGKIFSQTIREVYVLADEVLRDCNNSCEGSINNPYLSLVEVFIEESRKFDENKAELLRICILGEKLIIKDNPFDKYSDIFIDGILPVPVKKWSTVIIGPYLCKDNFLNCKLTFDINVKTQKFFFDVEGNLELYNLKFIGYDMALFFHKNLHNDCYYEECGCCNEEIFSESELIRRNCSGSLDSLLVITKPPRRYGLFTFKKGLDETPLNAKIYLSSVSITGFIPIRMLSNNLSFSSFFLIESINLCTIKMLNFYLKNFLYF